MSPPSGGTLVVGFGVTGQAVAATLVEAGQVVRVVDDRPTPSGRAAAAALGVELLEAPSGAALARLVAGVDLVVPSPGVSASHPVFSLAEERGVPVRSEIELAWDRLRSRPGHRPPMAAITGTNGKTTVTTLVASILEASGRRVATGGNIGRPLIEAVTADVDVVVAEVSSFQLQHTDRWRPTVSCWLNLAEDHLDWHPDMGHYAAAKARIWCNQGAGDTAVTNADDRAVAAAATAMPAGVRHVTFGTGEGCDYRDLGAGGLGAPGLGGPGGGVCGPGGVYGPGGLCGPGGVCGPGGLCGPGGDLLAGGVLPRAFPHDRANALAAAAVAAAVGATPAGIAAGLAGAPVLPHRVELVADRDGVRWYDDSKATTPASVLAAVAGFDSVVLIAGGRNKGLDLRALRATVPPVRAVVAIGEAAGEVRDAFGGAVEVRPAGDMAAAVAAASAVARPGDVVLLSPGCASFDWYASYAARGADFAARVRTHLGLPHDPLPPSRPTTTEEHR